MRITAALKAFMLQKTWIAADATDEVIKQVVGQKLLDGTLSASEFAELTKEAAPNGQAAIQTMIKSEVASAVAPILEAIKGLHVQSPAPVVPPTAPVVPPAAPVPADHSVQIAKAVADHIATLNLPSGQSMTGLLSRSHEVLERPNVRVKEAVERYSHNRTAAIYPQRCGTKGTGSIHPFAGRPAEYAGRHLDLPSERDKAISSAYFKFALAKAHHQNEIPRNLWMTDHDKDLLNWSVKNSQWTGYINSDEWGEGYGSIKVDRRTLNDMEQKALLDDTVSGGIEIAPIEFDDALITTPVLFGELFPLVNVIPVARGRRMKGGALTNPTFTSGVSEGTPIEPFNTANFITAFDTAIYTAVGAMEIGYDFEEDSPTTVGSTIIQKYGEKWMEWLDRVIAVGDGVTEPEGIFTSTAPTVINSEFGTNGPPTLNDYESLLFGVSKAFRNTKGSRNVFIANDTSYRRFKGIPRGPGDEQRVNMMDSYLSYTALEHPMKIQNDIPSNKIGFVNLGYYRAYRRLGLNIRIETAGQALATKNTRLIIVRARMGGRLELGGSAAIMTDCMY